MRWCPKHREDASQDSDSCFVFWASNMYILTWLIIEFIFLQKKKKYMKTLVFFIYLLSECFYLNFMKWNAIVENVHNNTIYWNIKDMLNIIIPWLNCWISQFSASILRSESINSLLLILTTLLFNSSLQRLFIDILHVTAG